MFPYSTIWHPVFWLSMGALVVFFFSGLRYWLNDCGITMTWWKWLLLSCWLFLLAISLAAAMTLMGEGESIAGRRFLMFFGIILIITAIVLWQLLKKKR